MRILLAAAITLATLSPFSTSLQAADYVRYCHALGFKWYYIPGTETCVNPDTGEVREDDGSPAREGGLLEQIRDANEGVALSLAMPTATVDAGKTFGAAMNFGTFNGEIAVGIGGAISAADGLTITTSIGAGLNRGTAGARAGINYAW